MTTKNPPIFFSTELAALADASIDGMNGEIGGNFFNWKLLRRQDDRVQKSKVDNQGDQMTHQFHHRDCQTLYSFDGQNYSWFRSKF